MLPARTLEQMVRIGRSECHALADGCAAALNEDDTHRSAARAARGAPRRASRSLLRQRWQWLAWSHAREHRVSERSTCGRQTSTHDPLS